MKEKLNKFEEKNKDLCWVNMQKNLKVYNLESKKEDFIYSGVRLYQADDVDKIIKEAQREVLQEIKLEFNIRTTKSFMKYLDEQLTEK